MIPAVTCQNSDEAVSRMAKSVAHQNSSSIRPRMHIPLDMSLRICIPCQHPGGADAVLSASFEESELLDYYEVFKDGRFEHIAQTRPCAGGCADPVEAIIRRGVKAVLVVDIGPDPLLRLSNAGVKILSSDRKTVREAVSSFLNESLIEIDVSRFGRARRNRGKDV